MKNKVFLLTENEENLFKYPKDDLLFLFSESNYSKEATVYQSETHQKFLFPKSLSLANHSVPAPLFITDSASSSLDVASYLIKQNLFSPFSSVLCRNQTAGRGQLRRHWHSQEGNIYAALCLPNIPPFSTDAAAPALGGIIAQALNEMGYEVFLKWPNDILQRKEGQGWCKVAGILLEERNNVLIAGIGINTYCAPDKEDLRKDSFINAGILQAMPTPDTSNLNYCNNLLFNKKINLFKKISQNQNKEIENTSNKNIEKIINYNMLQDNNFIIWHLWLTLVERIFLWYTNQVSKTNITPWQMTTQKYLAFMGETVKVHRPIIKESFCQREKELDYIQGRVSGINSQGELLLQTTIGFVTILGGTFSQEDNE